MKRLTVVQVLPALESGGVERGTLELSRYLVAHGHRSIVISAGGGLVNALEKNGGEHQSWNIGRKRPWTLVLIPRLRRFLTENRVDILHARSRMPAWVCYLAWRGMPPTQRPRFVTTVHGLYSVNRYSKVMCKGERVIAVSGTVEDYIRQRCPETSPERIALIPRGVDPNEFPRGYQPSNEWLAGWRADHPELAGKRVLLLPGRITRLKGHEPFIRLIRTLVDMEMPVHGLIVGGAHPSKQAYLRELQTLVQSLALTKHITFAGQRSDLKEIMATCDLVLSLSTKPESFGRTTLEALSLGLPLAGYDHGGVGEILGEIYPQGKVKLNDADDLFRVVTTLLGQHQPAGHAGSKNPFTLQRMLLATTTLYQDLVDTKATGT